jgi:hypothetical protein
MPTEKLFPEIEHDENVTQWDDYQSEIPSRFLRHGTSYDH